jgi:hypothetical protein
MQAHIRLRDLIPTTFHMVSIGFARQKTSYLLKYQPVRRYSFRRLTGFFMAHRIFLATILAVCAFVVSSQASAQNAAWRLVCFEQAGLEASLDKVINAQQFLRNDRLLKSGSCDFAQIPGNSTARFVAFHQSRNGFIFPTFTVRYATTSQRMYAADGIFLASAWRVSTKFRECRLSGFQETCIVPRTCQALDGFLTAGGPPRYVAVPSSCQTFQTQ